jgi:hypothetical protein
MTSMLVRLKLQDISPEQWRQLFAQHVRDSGESIRILENDGRVGLNALDPTVVAAIITGSVQVITTVITGLITCWVASRRRAKDDSPPPLQVLLVGSRDAAILAAAGVSPAELEHALKTKLDVVGELREISIVNTDSADR